MGQKTFKALIIDHDDSFIWNIKSWLSSDFETYTVSHTSQINFSSVTDYNLVIFSPGPKHPQDYPHSLHQMLLCQKFNIPVLGICLGMQMMTLIEGGRISQLAHPVHGKTSVLNGFSGNKNHLNNLTVARYHSLQCHPNFNFSIEARTLDDLSVQWIEHTQHKMMGWQFHPESFLTVNSHLILNELLKWMST